MAITAVSIDTCTGEDVLTPLFNINPFIITVDVDDGIDNYSYVIVDVTLLLSSTITYRAYKIEEVTANQGKFVLWTENILKNHLEPPLTLFGVITNIMYFVHWQDTATIEVQAPGGVVDPTFTTYYYYGTSQWTGVARYGSQFGGDIVESRKIYTEDNNSFWLPMLESWMSTELKRNILLPWFPDGTASGDRLKIDSQLGELNAVATEDELTYQTYDSVVFTALKRGYNEVLNIKEIDQSTFYTINLTTYSQCEDGVIIKYLDRHGMLRFSGFNHKYVTNEEGEEIGRYDLPLARQCDSDGNQQSIGYDVKRNIRCIRDQVEAGELEYLGHMATSAYVWIWDESRADWVKVYPQEGSFRVRNGDKKYNTVSITFELPAILTQTLI